MEKQNISNTQPSTRFEKKFNIFKSTK